MSFEFLTPVGEDLIEQLSQKSPNCIGNKIILHKHGEFPELKDVKVAIIGVKENRGNDESGFPSDTNKYRSQFYALYPGNWNLKIADLGDVEQGASTQDSYFLVKEIISDLLKLKIIPIIIGGSQDITYAMYRAYDKVEQMVNIATIDSSFDLGVEVAPYKSNSFLNNIIADEPNNLFNYSNIGYQTYYNSQYEIDLMDSLFFDAYRLGDVSADISIAEPIFRDSDLVSLDLKSVKSSDSGNFNEFVPNGFNGKEICALSRYAGISDKVSAIGIFNHQNLNSEATLIAQIVWYFIEGVNFRSNEYPFGSRENYLKYNVLIEDMELVFYKSDKTDRWWIQIPTAENQQGKLRANTLLPCTYDDYLSACKNEIPERWWKAYRKNIL